jgi:hypothetical protein
MGPALAFLEGPAIAKYTDALEKPQRRCPPHPTPSLIFRPDPPLREGEPSPSTPFHLGAAAPHPRLTQQPLEKLRSLSVRGVRLPHLLQVPDPSPDPVRR